MIFSNNFMMFFHGYTMISKNIINKFSACNPIKIRGYSFKTKAKNDDSKIESTSEVGAR